VASGLPVARPLYWPNELPVSVIEIREILRLWLQGLGLGGGPAVGHRPQDGASVCGPARACGLDRDGGGRQLTDELVAAVIAGVRPSRPDGKARRGKPSPASMSR
jgi:hypothetical protein